MTRELILLPKEKYERLMNMSNQCEIVNVKEKEKEYDGKDSDSIKTEINLEEDVTKQHGSGQVLQKTELKNLKETVDRSKSDNQEENRMDVDEYDGAAEGKAIKMSPEKFLRNVEKSQNRKRLKSKWLSFHL
ncbi:Hypothetical predicted protein [Mytilus galloprovincialis]|nr:Hypothetical predicted protein [Mytilus galloprovincialis]VDI34620.1 Hypothetical predicted protein [Mytilus galloprovincialis]VDI38510.1 Hypothetical predicted protein [Mytilus galloprovincialis]